MKEHRATSNPTELVTLSTWPKASSTFDIIFYIKIISLPQSKFQIPLQFFDPLNPLLRFPGFYINSQNEIQAYFRTKATSDFNAISNWEPLAFNVYHRCVMRQQQKTDGSFAVRFWIDGVFKGQKTNEIPNEVYQDLKILVGETNGDAEYYINRLDYTA